MGFTLTRRQLLRHAALVSATFPAAAAPGWRLAAQAQQGLAVPLHLELVTVTDTSAILTWFTGDPTRLDAFGRPAPVAAPGRVLIGTDPNPATWVEAGHHGPTPYHYVELTGLQPGVRYFFRAESKGLPALATTFDPIGFLAAAGDPIDTSNLGTFVTLVPPPGEEILRLAWCNDVHIGETISGVALQEVPGIGLPIPGGFPPGFPVDPGNPYWRTMGNAAVAEARARGAQLLFVNGDLTGEAEPESLAEVRTMLDAFGTLGGGRRTASGDFVVRAGDAPAYWVTRGNHDRAHRGEPYRGGRPVPGFDDLYDTFHDTFHEAWAPGATTSRFTVLAEGAATRWRFVGLDSNNIESGAGQLSEEQLGYVEAQLDAATEPTFVMLHHPAGDVNNLTSITPFSGVDVDQARAFRQLVAQRRDRVVGVYQGHTHRNNNTRTAETGDLPFYEGGATKEYPGGYTIVRLFETGYMVNFYKTAAPEARAWSERSRGEYLGLYPYYTLGSLGDRNWVYDADARVRVAPVPAPSDEVPGPQPGATTAPPTEPTAPPSESATPSRPPLPSTGSGLGAAAVGTAIALAVGARSHSLDRTED